MPRVTVDEARAELAELIHAALNGESVLIALDDEHIVQLLPVALDRKARQPGSAAGKIWMSDDFDAPMTAFKDYVP